MTIKHLFEIDEQLQDIEREILDQINLQEEVEAHFPEWHIVEMQRQERELLRMEEGLSGY